MKLYRVFPFLSSAADNEPGGVFFYPVGGKNRIDSPIPGAYRVFYAGDAPEGAIAEAFGRFDTWDERLIEAMPASPLVPRSRFALATFELPDQVRVRNLDDARALLEEHLRPSDVVTRDRKVSQSWAVRIHDTKRYAGISWWSYYDPRWHSFGLWDITRLKVALPPLLLKRDDTHVIETSAMIARRLM